MSLYLSLKDKLLKDILEGTYVDRAMLPTEHEMCEVFGLSRVTVRRALDELKKEGLVKSVQGQGTIVSHHRGGFPSSLDMIALISPMQSPFFTAFMQYFEKAAEENGSLVVFKQDFQGKALQSDDLFFRFLKRNIRNIVFWPQNEQIDLDLLRRLRSVGMNLVFFDYMFQIEVGDVVGVDNRDAITSLYREIRTVHSGKMIFIGYHRDDGDLSSEILRQKAFKDVHGADSDIYTILWGGQVEEQIGTLLNRLMRNKTLPAGIICSNGTIGMAVAKYIQRKKWKGNVLSTVDLIPGMENYPITVYVQPMKQLAEQSYQRLVAQNNEGRSWKANIYEVKGEIVSFGKQRV